MSTRNFDLYEAMALEALSQCKDRVTVEQIMEIADPRDREKLESLKMCFALDRLYDEALVHRMAERGPDAVFSITNLGRLRFAGHAPLSELHARAKAEAPAAAQNGATFDELRKSLGSTPAPVQVAVCNATEPRQPLTAAICVDEDELDDWWETLDVEQKADAFTGFSLRMYAGESHVHICERDRIPVAGTIGEREPAASEVAPTGGAA